MHMYFWDLGGSPSVRTLWSKYYDESDAVVWVVDARHFAALPRSSSDAPYSNSKGKGKASDAELEASEARELSWKLLSEVLMHPSLEGRPILIVANKTDDCESIPSDLTQTIKAWFAEKLAHIDDDTEPASSSNNGTDSKQNGNIFADDDEPYRGPAAAGSTLNERDYEWDVLLASALEGTGVHDAIDWLSIRVQGAKPGRR